MRIPFISIPLIPSMLITFTGNLSYLYVRIYIYIYNYIQYIYIYIYIYIYTHIPQTTPFAPKVPLHHLFGPFARPSSFKDHFGAPSRQVRQGEAQDVLGPPLLRPGPWEQDGALRQDHRLRRAGDDGDNGHGAMGCHWGDSLSIGIAPRQKDGKVDFW